MIVRRQDRQAAQASRPLAGTAILLLLAVWATAWNPALLHAGMPLDRIQILGLIRDASGTRLRWEGGFPPYHVRYTHDLNTPWNEHPRPLATNEFVISPDKAAQFFQIRTECEPLEITDFFYTTDAEFLFLKWRGGTPPFRVELKEPGTDLWEPAAPLTSATHFEGPSGGSGRLIRIASVSDHTAPVPPTNAFLYAARCDRILLGWDEASDGNAGSGVAAYLVYRDGVQVAQLGPAERLYLDEGLTPDATYRYQVAAFDRFGNESAPSIPILATTPDCSVTLTNLEYVAGALHVRWDRSEDARVAGYVVHWGHGPGDYSWQMDAMAEDSVTITDLVPGRAYFISVTAYSVDGVESDPAPELVFVPPSTTESAYSLLPPSTPIQPPNEPLP